KLGVNELSGSVHNTPDMPGNRRAVNVTVEHAHEDGYPPAGLFSQAQLFRCDTERNLGNPPISRADHQILVERRHARRIAEEVYTPRCDDHSEPKSRLPEPTEEERCKYEYRDKRKALATDRDEHALYRADDGLRSAHGIPLLRRTTVHLRSMDAA